MGGHFQDSDGPCIHGRRARVGSAPVQDPLGWRRSGITEKRRHLDNRLPESVRALADRPAGVAHHRPGWSSIRARGQLLAGFVDDAGLVKFCAYSSAWSDSAFTGSLSPQGGLRDLTGTFAWRSGVLEEGELTYSFGTLAVRKFARDFRDRVYGSESRHVF